MAVPTKPVPPPIETSDTGKSIHQQRDLILAGFEGLSTKHDLRTHEWPEYFSINQTVPLSQASWKSDLDRLESSLLPLLGQQLDSLYGILAKTSLNLRKDKGPKLQLILELQTEVDHTLYQIFSYATILRAQQPFSLAKSEDHYSKDLKEFRLTKLFYKLHHLMHEVCGLFRCYFFVVAELKLSRKQYRIQSRKSNSKGNARMLAGMVSPTIGRTIDYLKGHELTIIQEEWTMSTRENDDAINKIIKLINNTCANSEENDDQSSEIEGILSEPFIQLARSVIPVIKLSSLFYRKLARTGLSKNIYSQPYTEMSSDQLSRLSVSVEIMSREVGGLFTILNRAEEEDEADTAEALTDQVEALRDLFQSNISLVTLYVLPLIIPKADDPLSQNLKAWLVTWNNQFHYATGNLISATQSYALAS
ncbi:hypothetical protein Pst134EA_013031 [Puccinia striiformis f. sp. tritici]|uniref:hypothetical protein n=1 Tax=Puccinia striiformis f. sp. tritici TaxID=168172 RepID=UPI000A124BD0|nr:hypothetical protein Pst134EA_013031 [Puccinia striiformis f. sp. tritici]KAH9465137.1 hypothetical protein Pst134EA_013031 [Puccinia striiformis f. sp. tritici]